MDTQPAIVSYVRTKGLFAGLNLEGTRMGFAPKINAEHYGAEVSAREILLEEAASSSEPGRLPGDAGEVRRSVRGHGGDEVRPVGQ